MRRIICAGNRYVPGDDAGPRVHDLLNRSELPPGIEVVDGGLRGLDLADLVAGAEKVVFVDQVAGYGPPGTMVLLGSRDLPAGAPPGYGHAGGLAYLIRALPILLDGPQPELALVGFEGPADEPAISALAREALREVTS